MARTERWSQTEYQFIIKTKGSRSSLHFRNAGRVVDPFKMNFDELELAYQELTRWQNEIERFYKRKKFKVHTRIWWLYVRAFLRRITNLFRKEKKPLWM